MKVIDALIKIADGDEFAFKINDGGENESIVYIDKNKFLKYKKDDEDIRWYIDEEWLNMEVTIIENELTLIDPTPNEEKISEKINELINEVNKLKEDKQC